MLKTACCFTGDNYKLVEADTPASKKKIVALSIAMLIPVMIWIFIGFMLSFQILKAGFGWAILTAFVCGTIVFLIEKLIIMAIGSKWLTFFRICIGVVVGLLGSMAIDEVVFKDDIDLSVAALKETYISDAKKMEEDQFIHLNDYPSLEKSITKAKEKYDHAEEIALEEADGTNGTKTRGVGDVAQLKNQKAIERKSDRDNLLVMKEQLDKAKDSLVNLAALRTAKSFNEHGLLTRVKALFQLVIKDSYMLGTYILFTLLMFFFEFMVVVLKLTWKKTNYERKVEMIEEIGQRRMEFLLKKESTITDPGYYLPQLKEARDTLNKNISVFGNS